MRPFFQNILLVAAILLGWLTPVRTDAEEVQSHGLIFEHWVCDTFFDGYRPSGYTQKWDIPAEVNRLADTALAGLPANPKATKYGGPVGLGDALRQFDIDEPFILILGYWEQPAPEQKRFVKLLAPRVEPDLWRKLWGPVTRADLERLDAIVKDRSLTPAEARRKAQQLKSKPPFSEAVFTLNPKIDSKSQRRLQCSLRFSDVLKHLAPEASREPETEPALWGVTYPGPLDSRPRTFAAPEPEPVSNP